MGRFRRAASLGQLAGFAEEEEAIEEARVFASRFAAYPEDEVNGASIRLLEASSAVFEALKGRLAQTESPTDEEVAVTATGPDDWAVFRGRAGVPGQSVAASPRPAS